MRVLILGAGGFIGQHIVAALTRSIGADKVIAGVRRPGVALTENVEQRQIDANDLASIRAASADVSCIVNSVMGSDQAIVASAHNVGQLARDGAVERAVHLSSIVVQGLRDGIVRESDGFGAPVDGYAAAKIAAEAAFSDLSGERGVILRPGLVHGPGSALWTRRIGRLLAAGRLGPLGERGEGVCNLVDVEDVADAVATACHAPQAAGRAFALVAAPSPSWNAYFADLAAAMAAPVRPVSAARLAMERALAYPLTALRAPARRIGFTLPDAVTPGLARLFPVRMQFESSAVGILLPAWRDYAGSLRRSADWLAAQ